VHYVSDIFRKDFNEEMSLFYGVIPKEELAVLDNLHRKEIARIYFIVLEALLNLNKISPELFKS